MGEQDGEFAGCTVNPSTVCHDEVQLLASTGIGETMSKIKRTHKIKTIDAIGPANFARSAKMP